MKQAFSILGDADSYAHMNGRRIQYEGYPSQEVYDNDYMARSTIPNDISEKKHILFLGDSFIFGDNLERHEIVSAHFEKILNNDEYCVINLGVNGSSFEHATLRLQQWCNTFPDNIHSVYVGITALSRSTRWTVRPGGDNEEYGDELDNDMYSQWIPFPENIQRFDFLLNMAPPKKEFPIEHKSYLHSLGLISKINCLHRFETNLMHVKSMASVHNFNVYAFHSIRDMIVDAEVDVIKTHIESNNFIYNKRDLLTGSGKGSFHLPCRHWNTTGCEYVGNKLLDETKHWY